MKALLIFVISAACPAQDLNLKSLEHLAAKASDTVDVRLDGSLLRMAASFLSGDKADEAQVKKLVAGLTGVYVRSYEFNKPGEFTDADVDAIRLQLRAPAWSRVVTVQSKKDGENTEVYLRVAGKDQMGGLTVITSERKELTVVQVLGNVKLSDLEALSALPGVPEIGMGGKLKKEENE